jgi:protoheme IX farnesyltransferase
VPVFGFTGRLQLSVVAMILTLAAGFWFLYYGFRLFKNQTEKAARQLMLSSVVYITLIQIIYVSDKFIRLWI